MAYSVQTWADNDPRYPVSAARMNHIESGIDAVANGGSLSPIFNVKTLYGAIGNGVADDTTAIQNAITAAAAAGGIVYFPVGTYLVSSTLSTPASCQFAVTLMGAGKGGTPSSSQSTRIVRSGNFNLISVAGTGSATNSVISHGLGIIGMTLDGGGMSTAVVSLVRCAAVLMRDVRIKNATGANAYGLYAQQLWNSVFDAVNFEGVGDLGTTVPAVYLTDSGDADVGNTNTVQFTDCIWEANNYTDLRLDGSVVTCQGVIVTNGKWERSGGYAIHLSNATQCSFVGGLVFVNSALSAVRFDGGARNSFIGLEINEVAPATSTYLIELATGARAAIVGCSFYGAGTAHIRLDSAFGSATITGNTHGIQGSEAPISDVRTSKVGLIATDQQVRAYDGVVTKTNAGPITDGGFAFTPVDGALAVDTTNQRPAVRIGGSWWSIPRTVDAAPQIPALVAPYDLRVGSFAGITLNNANEMRAVRVIIPRTGTLTDLSVCVLTSSGNIDVGVYSTAATRGQLYHTGSIACPSINVWTVVGNPALAVTEGTEYDFAIAADNTTAAFAGINAANGAIMSLPANFIPSSGAAPKLAWTQLTSFPLPSSVVEANCASSAKMIAIIARIT